MLASLLPDMRIHKQYSFYIIYKSISIHPKKSEEVKPYVQL